MIIDTDKLVEFINKRDEIEFPQINDDNCPYDLSNMCLERRSKSLELIHKIETLVKNMENLLKIKQEVEQGFIILNKETRRHAWDDNTEFHPDKETADVRVDELKDVLHENIDFEVIPATLIYKEKQS